MRTDNWITTPRNFIKADTFSSSPSITDSGSPRYAAYQKEIRRRQVERAEKMVASGKRKAERKNPNDPARFVGKLAVTKDGEAAGIEYYLDKGKIAEEARYDRLYAVCTDLLDDDVAPYSRSVKDGGG